MNFILSFSFPIYTLPLICSSNCLNGIEVTCGDIILGLHLNCMDLGNNLVVFLLVCWHEHNSGSLRNLLDRV